jgi:hypothetical protein
MSTERDPIDVLHELIEAGWLPPDKGKGRGANRAAMGQAAIVLGCSRANLYDRLKRIKRSDGREPDWSRYRPLKDQFTAYEEIHAPPPVEKPRVRVKAYTPDMPPDGPVHRVVVIGDLHDRPGRTKEHATWIGRHITASKPDHVVCIGDFASLDSLSTFDKPGSAQDIARPSFVEDIASLEECLEALHRDFDYTAFPITMTWGNHEHRAQRAADLQPKINGDLPLRVRECFSRYRWNQLDYGRYFYLGAVGFTHIPHNAAGKEFRGEHVERQLGPRLTFSLVCGHTHKRVNVEFPKIGPGNRVSVVNTGTSMPWGTVEHYANLSVTGWSYSLTELRIQGGMITGVQFIDMTDLGARYGD